MSDDPQTFQLPDPAEQPEEPQDSLLGLPPGASNGPVIDEQKPAEGAQSLESDIISEIRQSLALEEAEQSRKTSTTGRLIRRITGTLKKVTGPLGRTGPLSRRDDETYQPGSAPAQMPPSEIPDDFLSGRLEGTTISEQPVFPERAEEQDTYQPVYGDTYESVSFEEEDARAEAYQLEEPDLTGDEPISLLDSGAIAAMGKAEEDARATENEPDWMAEIRSETAELEGQGGERPEEPGSESAPPAPSEKRRGFTNPLRSFITGVLGGESRRKQAEEEISDDLLTGRLNRSMKTGPFPSENPPDVSAPLPDEPELEEEEPLTGTGALRALLGDAPEPPVVTGELEEDRTATGSLKPSFFSDLDAFELETGSLNPDKLTQSPAASETAEEAVPEDRFDVFNQKLPEKPATGGLILDEPLDLTPEEEQLLWGRGEHTTPAETVAPESAPTVEPPMFTEEDIWGPPAAAQQPEVSQEAWIRPVQIGPEVEPAEITDDQYAPLTDEDYAQAYLTGQLPERHKEKPPVNLMHQALVNAEQDEFNPQNLRAIALEGMEDEGPSASTYPGFYREEMAREEEEPSAKFSLKAWLAKRSPVERFLMVEGLVAVLAMLVAVPFFIYVIAGGHVPSVAAVQTHWASPKPLPADVPYPVGLTLPGGWSFPLQKSTFVKGEWKPAKAEWLEGTELRRVVALPWNRQTEAVIQTFKTGDKVQINLSNQDTMSFTVKSVDRVSTLDTSVFSDLSPSLVIVLYKEDSQERWIVQCQPIR